ncbi:MAG: glycosyl transferase [Leifsonia sp.]|nr:glycosyl transferase [Leifsonia sp.]
MASPQNVVIVGPTHPHTGGIAQHNTRLAHELLQRGVNTRIESWSAQYPRRSRNGLGELPADKPELPLFPHVVERLKWYSPLSWISLRRRLRNADTSVFAVVTPFHAVPYAPSLIGRVATERVAIVHNVVPHESSRLDRFLMRWMLTRMDRLIVHNEAQAELARGLGVKASCVTVSPLPFPGIGEGSEPMPPPYLASTGPLRLLFFGMVRHYKGLDHLLEALALTDSVELEVTGHFWEPADKYQEQIHRLGISDRVQLRDGYVETADMAAIFARNDVVVLPYRSGTSSIVTDLAFAHLRPVIVTDVGDLSDEIEEAVTGLVVPPLDTHALADAIQKASDRALLSEMSNGVARRPDKSAAEWALYVSCVLRE